MQSKLTAALPKYGASDIELNWAIVENCLNPAEGGKMTFESFLRLLGQNIARFRKSRELTQKKAADLMGISYRYYQNIERGVANIRMSTFFRIAKLLGVQPAEMLTNKTDHKH